VLIKERAVSKNVSKVLMISVNTLQVEAAAKSDYKILTG
jgi:hypothetical protein